jgi:hypothetical protein
MKISSPDAIRLLDFDISRCRIEWRVSKRDDITGEMKFIYYRTLNKGSSFTKTEG